MPEALFRLVDSSGDVAEQSSRPIYVSRASPQSSPNRSLQKKQIMHVQKERKRKLEKKRTKRTRDNVKKSYLTVALAILAYRVFVFVGNAITGNAGRFAANELEANLRELNSTGVLARTQIDGMEKEIAKLQRKREKRIPQFVTDVLSVDEKYQIRFTVKDRTRRGCRRVLETANKIGIENVSDVPMKMPSMLYDLVFGTMRKTFVLRRFADGLDSFFKDVYGSVVLVWQLTVDRLLFEKMNADVYFDKIRKSLKENKEKNSDRMFHSMIGKMVLRVMRSFTEAKTNVYEFCAYAERFENVATPVPPSKRMCEKEKIALETAYRLSPFADSLPVFHHAFGEWTETCSSRCSEGFQSRVNCHGDVELRRCRGKETYGCDGQCGSDAKTDCAGVCRGDTVVDACGVCGGNNRSIGCDGVCFSPVVLDDKGTCCFAEDVEVDDKLLVKICSRTHEEARLAKQKRLEEEEEEKRRKRPNSFKELLVQFREARTKQRAAYTNFFRLLVAIRITCEIASKKVGHAIAKVVRGHFKAILFVLNIFFGGHMRSFVGFLVILLVSVITVDCLFTLGVVERALDRSKTAQMLANRSSVKSIQDIKNLEKKFACFKKEAKTTLESFLAMVLRIFDVVLAKAIVLFWKLKNMLEEYYAAAADTRRRERKKPSSSSSPPSTTDSKKER
jgi:hypothetical protein